MKRERESARRVLPYAICHEVQLPDALRLRAAMASIKAFPANAPFGEFEPARLAVLTQKYWGRDGADLTVGFMERPNSGLIDKVLAYANTWGEFSNVRFRWTQTSPVIRVSFGPGGYYSYLGRDCLLIPSNQHTMNLQGFSLRTPESEWKRVVPHEFGHALGYPHEQQRKSILNLLDEAKTIKYYMRTQGWTEDQVRQQILVPLEERSIMGSDIVDQSSIMCYHFPGSITKTGQPIPGGSEISFIDKEFAAKVYPLVTQPPPPPPPGVFLPPVLEARDKPGADGKTIAKYVLTTMPGGSV